MIIMVMMLMMMMMIIIIIHLLSAFPCSLFVLSLTRVL